MGRRDEIRKFRRRLGTRMGLVLSIAAGLLFFNNCTDGFKVFDSEVFSSSDFALRVPVASQRAMDAFQCTPDRVADLSVTNHRRLNRIELLNTVRDLVGGSVSLEINELLNQIPSDAKSHDYSTNETAVNSRLVSAHFNLARGLANQLSAPAALAAFGERFQMPNSACLSSVPMSEACLEQFLKSVGRVILRHRVTSEDLMVYQKLYADGLGVSHESGARVLLMGLFQSARFVYHVEIDGRAMSGAGEIYELTPDEVANRLSYLFWGTMPDLALLRAVDAGDLTSDDGIRRQLPRLLSDPRSKAHFRNFVSEWLKLDKVGLGSYPADFLNGISTDGLREAMIEELHDFTEDIVWKSNGTYRDLMLSQKTFARTAPLASIYGVSTWAPGQAPPVLAAGPRRGLLGRAALLLDSKEYTSPIRRGVRIREQILCDEIPPPPQLPDLTIITDFSTNTELNTRQRYTSLTQPPACMGCHGMINPLGFALEGFDTLGRVRQEEKMYVNHVYSKTLPIDTTSTPQLDGENRAVSGAEELSNLMAESQKANSCVVKQWFQYAQGRPNSSQDSCAMAAIYDRMLAGANLKEVLSETILSPSLRYKRVDK